eukprot:1672533-Rhodomonas_salina.2
MSGTELAHAATRMCPLGRFRTAELYWSEILPTLVPAYARAMRCLVLTFRRLVLSAYARAMRCPVLRCDAMSSTDVAHGTSDATCCYGLDNGDMRRIRARYPAMRVLRHVRYELGGTNATRLVLAGQIVDAVTAAQPAQTARETGAETTAESEPKAPRSTQTLSPSYKTMMQHLARYNKARVPATAYVLLNSRHRGKLRNGTIADLAKIRPQVGQVRFETRHLYHASVQRDDCGGVSNETQAAASVSLACSTRLWRHLHAATHTASSGHGV